MRRLLAFLLFCLPVPAATYYVDPAAGTMSNAGSADSPWSTLAEVVRAKSFNGGDTIYLSGGYHGQPSISGYNSSDVVIMAREGHRPLCKNVSFGSARHWLLDGVTITPEAVQPYARINPLVRISGSFNTVKNCSLYSVKDASGWSAADWNSLACNGMDIIGTNNTASNNLIKNTKMGLSVLYDADHCLVEYNSVINFSGDGMRGLGDYGTFQYNYVTNCYKVDGNHDDLFQSWSREGGVNGAGTVRGMILRGNHFNNYEDPSQKLLGGAQGIGLFDGMFEGWLVENNLVTVNHWHGITFCGAINCTIVNNTVLTAPGASKGTWIEVANHKNGTPSRGNLARNNLFSAFKRFLGTTADHNFYGAAAKACVNDYNNMDYTLKPGLALVIDAGSSEGAPSIDKVGSPRPYGAGVDLGCYEYAPQGIQRHGYREPLRGAGNACLAPQPLRREGVLNVTTSRGGMLGLSLFNTDGERMQYLELATGGGGSHALLFTLAALPVGMAAYAVTFDGQMMGRGSIVIAR